MKSNQLVILNKPFMSSAKGFDCLAWMKSLLSMSAIIARQHDSELKIYSNKRVEEGKPKMGALNIIRNKIVSRIFATVKRGTPYVKLAQFARLK